jgi:hypothetical protein
MSSFRNNIEQEERTLAQRGEEYVESCRAKSPEGKIRWFFLMLDSLVHKVHKALDEESSPDGRRFAIRELARLAPNLIPMLQHLLQKLAAREESTAGEDAAAAECLRLLDEELSHLRDPSVLEIPIFIARQYKTQLVIEMAKARDARLSIRGMESKSDEWAFAFLTMSDILGVGYGTKLVNGTPSENRPAIRVYVPTKKPRRDLRPCEIVPATINGLPTDVVELGEITQATSIKCGSRIGSSCGGVGTLGCLVERPHDIGRRFLLSCSHVLANCPEPKRGEVIFSLMDSQANEVGLPIASLEDWTVPGELDSVDAAIAELIDPQRVSPEILQIGQIAIPTVEPKRDQFVAKYGSTTGHTLGVFQDITATIKVKYATPRPSTVLFHDELGIGGVRSACFADHGDSGSLVLEALRRNPLGMVFAVGRGIAFAHKIAPVLDRCNAAE